MSRLVILSLVSVLMSCGFNKPKEESWQMTRQARIRLEQYVVQGKGLFTKHCSACHQDSGEGLASLYPPLKQSDYLLEDIPRAACIIKNGLVESIKVNGKPYSQMMPGLAHLTPLEIAEILTYITNSWGNEAGISGVKDVEKWLTSCK